ncbi:MAG: sigma-54 dependent transcriptional regulator [Anaeromyxobacteraceae bacterium]|nr:sigma-54 dependent transcriptional regulator [Anaeromyxobacteraceae bacterium]
MRTDPASIFVVDDDAHVRELVGAGLRAAGFAPVGFDGGEACLAALRSETPAAVVTDLAMPGLSGLETLDRIRAHHAFLPVVVLTGTTDPATVVEAMRRGAYDFHPKPIDRTKLVTTLANAVEKHAMAVRLSSLEREAAGAGMPGLVGESPAMKELVRLVDRVAATDVSVCIHGESGTGKELVARAIHARSSRAAAPFVAVNCAALPEALQASELFGHEAGAFTGASARRAGGFEQAAGGTLLLDEVADLAPSTQARLLRVLARRAIQRVGSSQELPVDFRLLTATHQDLAAAVRAGRFREDLYFRIMVFELEVPPLRARGQDVALLARHFVAEGAQALRGHPVALSDEAVARLLAHGWPGNVRELRNACQRALVTCDGGRIEPRDLPGRLGREPALTPVAGSLQAWRLGPEGAAAEAPSAVLEEPAAAPSPTPAAPAEGVLTLAGMERQAILDALAQFGGNRSRVSKELGIGRTTLYRKLKEYGIP